MSILTKHKRESPYILLVTDAWQPQRDNKCMISERNILFFFGWGGAAGDREPAIYTSSPGFAEKSSDIVTLSFIKN